MSRWPKNPRHGSHRVFRHSFRYVQVGDTVTRMLGGAPMKLAVTDIDERFIYCGPPDVGWKFERDYGIEVDEEIGWGPEFGIAGSYLVHPSAAPTDDE